jgi:ribosomal protein L40E
MAQAQSVFGPEFGKKAVRLAITLVGLLVLRAVLGALPMLSNASAIGSSLMSPLVIADAVVDTLLLVVLLRFGLSTGRSVAENSARFADVGKIISLTTVVVVLLIAYKQYETPTACLVVSKEDFSKIGSNPQTSVNPEDILQNFGQIVQQLSNAGAIKVTGSTLVAVQNAAVVLLRQPPDIYGWTFLILIAIPVVGIVVLVSRNLDAFTDVVFHAALSSPSTARSPAVTGSAAGAPATLQCGNCGQPTTADAKFCPNCGTASRAATSIASDRKFCPSCGADNPATAKFCKDCGQAA